MSLLAMNHASYYFMPLLPYLAPLMVACFMLRFLSRYYMFIHAILFRFHYIHIRFIKAQCRTRRVLLQLLCQPQNPARAFFFQRPLKVFQPNRSAGIESFEGSIVFLSERGEVIQLHIILNREGFV